MVGRAVRRPIYEANRYRTGNRRGACGAGKGVKMNPVMKLRAVLNTLEGVQVAGRENWDRMLGSMQAIEEVVQVLSAPPAPEKETDVEEG